MNTPRSTQIVGLLLSGGLDSSILAAHLLDSGISVQPFYVLTGVTWEGCELSAVERMLSVLRSELLKPLITLSLPLADLYEDHWSTTGRHVPSATSTDEAVYLPGRNLLLALKPALWCKMHGIQDLALAALKTNPFADTSPEFFHQLEGVLNSGMEVPIRLVRPFALKDKAEVMRLGARYPLNLTFSCISPIDGLHCGGCNKCAERQAAFREGAIEDPTVYYVRGATTLPPQR
jgi:7-cyano-7-deazaguanine synthase